LVFIPQTRTTLCEKLLLDAVRGEVGCWWCAVCLLIHCD
jgi:hypothetical protein